MSRCFPFPPPGYVSKARPDDVNLIIKEKKQKKHGDKKDKDNKERSKRKEEKSEGSHKEDKKRKREEHEDKKDRKKEKQSSTDEKKILENQNGRKLVPNIRPIDSIQDRRTFPELGKTIRNDIEATNNPMVQKITLVEKTKTNLPGKLQEKITLVEKTKTNLPGKLQENNSSSSAGMYDIIKDKREPNRMAVGQSSKADAKSLENGSVGNCHSENRIKLDGNSLLEKRNEGKEWVGNNSIFGERDGCNTEDQNKNTRGDDKKIFIFGGDGCTKEDQNKNARAEEKKRKKERKKEKKERKKEKKKEKEKIKQEVRKEEIKRGDRKEEIKQGTSECNSLDFSANNPANPVKESLDCGRNLPNHKALNGFSYDNGIWPNKASGAAFPSHQAGQNGGGLHPSQNIINLAVEKGIVVKNQKDNGKLSSPQSVISNTASNSVGEHVSVSINKHGLSNGLTSSHFIHIKRKAEPCHPANTFPEVQPIVDNKIPLTHPRLDNGINITMKGPDGVHKTDNKELRMNGFIEGEKPWSAPVKPKESKQKSMASTKLKPPHPDMKYLSQILSVPEVEWPQCDDDQEWLFGCKNSEPKRPKLDHSPKRVWAEAIQLESVDITALPYAIPY